MINKIELILNTLQELTLLELSTLIKNIEEKFNIEKLENYTNLKTNEIEIKNQPIIEEKKLFNISLIEVASDKKITVLKIIRNLTGLGLKESKDFVDNIPKIIKENITKEECDSIKKEIEENGGKISIQ